MQILIFFIVLAGLTQAQSTNELIGKAREHHLRNADSCIYYCDLLLALDRPAPPDSIVTKAMFMRGWNLHMTSQYDDAIEQFKDYLRHPATSEDQVIYIRSLGKVGVGFREKAAYDSAMHYLQIYDALVDQHMPPTTIEAKLELSELHRMMGRKDLSNELKLEAVNRARQSGNRMDRMMSLYYYLDDNANDLGKPAHQDLLSEYLELIGKPRDDGSMDYSHAAMLLLNFSDQEKLKILEQDVQQLNDAGRDKGYLWLIRFLIDEYIRKEQYELAATYARQGLQTAELRNEIPYQIEYNQVLSEISALQQDYASAFGYQEAHIQLKDSVFTSDVLANVDSLRVRFATAEKEKQIADQQLEIQNRINQRNILIGGIALLIWFGLFAVLYLSYRTRATRRLAESERAIHEQRVQQLEQEKQILAMNSMIEGQEAERMRIARDLHDGLGGLLGTVKAHFSIIQDQIKKLEAIQVYDEVDKLIDTASAEVRRISHNMSPQALRIGGLKDALSDLTSQLGTHGLDVRFEWNGEELKMDETSEVMLYRIAQELTNNAMKYANATTLLVQVNHYDHEISMVIEDNGTGFDVEEARAKGGLGLRSVESRVKYLGGTIDIDSEPGQGTTVSIHVNKA